MPAVGVETQFQKLCDNLAAWKGGVVSTVTDRTLLWQIIHNANDEAYELAVQGSSVAAADVSLSTIPFGNSVATIFGSHNTYFRNTLSLSTGIDGYLTLVGWRVSEFFNLLYHDATGSYFTPANVFPRYDLNLGSHAKTGNVFTPGDVVNTTSSGLGRIQAVVPEGVTIGGATYTVATTLKRQDATTVALNAAFSAAAVAGTAIVFGEQVLSGNAASGQKVVLVAATAQFKAGEPVLIGDTANMEQGVVASISANTSITLVNNLINAYTTGAGAKAWPLFSAVTAATTANGTNGDEAVFTVDVDRVVSNMGAA